MGNRRVVLCVEDDPMVQDLVRFTLEPEGFEIITAQTGLEAIFLLNDASIDLGVIDIQLPDITGYVLATYIRTMPRFRSVPLIALSGAYSMEFLQQTVVAGFDAFLQKPFPVQKLRQVVQDVMGERQARNRVPLDTATELSYMRQLSQDMVHDLIRYVTELGRKTELLERQARLIEEMLIYMINSIVRILETNERYTAGHSQRVGEYAVMIGQKMGLTQQELRVLHLGGLFHDLGKIAVDRCIIQKPGPLTSEEWEEIRRHPRVSYELLREIPFLEEAAQIAGEHHERFDGQGYPWGKRGEEMAITSHIVIMADAFDAMTSHRSYRRARPLKDVIAEIERCTGSQFHPEVAELWLRELRERGETILREVHRQYPIGGLLET